MPRILPPPRPHVPNRPALESLRGKAKQAGVVPNIHGFTTVLGTLMVEGKREEAKALMREMREEHGVEPNERTWEKLRRSDLEFRRIERLAARAAGEGH